jgi:hypothetical protein
MSDILRLAALTIILSLMIVAAALDPEQVRALVP